MAKNGGNFDTPQIDPKELKRRREKLGAAGSLRKFAAHSGVSKVTIINVEKGRFGASPEMIVKLAKALDCQPWDLCKDKTRWPKDLFAASVLDAAETWFEQQLKRLDQLKAEMKGEVKKRPELGATWAKDLDELYAKTQELVRSLAARKKDHK